jgi:moderate conductance mechanosensitive channel
VRGLLHLLEHHGVPADAAKTLVVVALFALASLVGRLSLLAARRIELRTAGASGDSPLVAFARRETGLSLFQTSVRYLAFLLALALALVVVTGARGVSTLAGASFVAVVVAFAAQRFLIDLIAGFLMFFEGWYTIGSTVVLEPMKLEGVVEEVSLRMTALRDVSGELVRVHNSQILAVRVLPQGTQRVEIELFVHDREAGQELIERVAQIVPAGPTSFVDPPCVRATQQLDDDLHRITADAAVAAGRLWLAEDLLPSLLKERSDDGLIVHGPVVLPVDEQAQHRFARAERRLRERRSAAPRRAPARRTR